MASGGHDVRFGRAYDPPSPEDGKRVLVDRVWPRGLSKDKAQLDEWCKTVAPSTELRKWYGHKPERFDEFTHRYTDELADEGRAGALNHLRELAQQDTVTLLTASKSVDISQAAVLVGLLRADG